MLVLVVGGTGFIGSRLVDALVARGDQVTVVSRDPAKARHKLPEGVKARGYPPPLDGFDAVINLAGEGLFDRRWNDEVKREIRDSRVEGTRTLAPFPQIPWHCCAPEGWAEWLLFRLADDEGGEDEVLSEPSFGCCRPRRAERRFRCGLWG